MDALDGIAIVGMAGRFPGAGSVDELWRNLLAGRESITRFAPEQLSPLVSRELAAHPRYVPVRGVLADVDRFDAAFFGIAPREALLIDPQQRVLLELAWNALEHAGVDPSRFPGSVGVYAGTSNNTYRRLVESRADLLQAAGEFAAAIASEKDYVATRIAHRLDLTGPALSLHTACSTSLVAVAQAWYALMSWQCDLALAGAINIVVPQESGYLPVEGGIDSDDGHCRPFDAAANGTVFSCGGAMVVLKRLADAVADGDTVYAVIRGVGVNNDGGDKASFGAPSVRGQAAVIRQALDSAGVTADSIDYVEAHGTATPLGDPIEVAALNRAFAPDTTTPGNCWLGSVKGNFGHLNAASGIAGLIKTALALHHGTIPATLHYRTPNPEIDFAGGPFKVADHPVDWPRGGRPRRAGVSSFGVGGTNAHVILEEAPLPAAASPGRRVSLLPLSARDEAALQRRAMELAGTLADIDDAALADVGYTLAVGRKALPVRGCVVAADVAEARERLAHIAAHAVVAEPPALVMLFPGQGSQHAGMARELVQHELVFREAFERCCAIASARLGRDLRALILPAAGEEDTAASALAETRCTQPALFVVEYALAELWASWGLEPTVMIGHSIGEYVAACRAGVFTLEDALALVVARGAAMFAQPRGSMLVVRMDADALAARLPEGVEIAGRNAPTQTVLSGTDEAIAAFAAVLENEEIGCTRLRVSHAFHSALMDGALPLFRRAFDGIALQPPQRAFYSCVSGRPITPDEATSVDYWCRQLRAPVRFADAVRHVLEQGPALLLEAGPSQALTGLVRGMLDGRGVAVASLGPAARPGEADAQVLRALGECWCAGVTPDWPAFHAGQVRRRVPLPGYPFQGPSYWVEPAIAPAVPMPAAGAQEQNPMPSTMPSSAAPPVSRAAQLATELRELFGNLVGSALDARHDDASFIDLGFDSLALTQAALAVDQRYGVKLKFRRLMEDMDSVRKLAEMLDATLPADRAPTTIAAPMPTAPAVPAGDELAAMTQLVQNQMVLLQQQAALLSRLAERASPSAVAVSDIRLPQAAAPVPEAIPAELPDKVPLTDAQLGRWLGMHYSEAIAPSYNEATRLHLRGALDEDALQRAFDTVVARHDVLAMHFAEDGSGQTYVPPSPVRLERLDLRDAADPAAALDTFVAEQTALPFHRLEPPLLRAFLATLTGEEHALVLVGHHIVMDGWSFKVFCRELAESYNAFHRGETPALPPADPWRAFVLDERARRDGEPGQVALDWWLERYRSLPDPLTLPTDRPRGRDTGFASATFAGHLDDALVQQLRELARAQRVTLFAVLLGAFYALLHRLSGQDDLVCGVPFAGQAASRYGQAVGDGDNTLPLRVAVASDESFGALVQRVQGVLLDAGEHQDISLARIANALKLPRDTGRLPLAEVLFNFSPGTAETPWDGLAVKHGDLPKTHTNWDIEFHLSEHAGRLEFLLHYNRDLFDDVTIGRWCGYLDAILRQGAAQPQRALGDCVLMDDAERRLVLEGWNDTAVAFDRGQSLVELIERTMQEQPYRTAVSCQGIAVDYAGLDAASRALALALGRRGLGRGDYVGVCVPRTVDMLIAVLGVLRSGAAYVPLDPEFPAERLRYMAEKAGVRYVLSGPRDAVPPVLVQAAELLPVAQLMREPEDGAELPQVRGDDLAYVLFTSGSTGQPKGVRILHRNLVNFLRSMQREPGFGADDVLCAVTTLSFDIAGLEMYLPLLAGGQIVIATEADHRDPRAMCELIERSRCTVLQTTPSLLKLLEEIGYQGSLANLRLLVGGEALPPALARSLVGRCRGLWNMYGPTETTIWSTLAPIDADVTTVPLGKPIDNTRIYVLDPRGQPVPPGVIGEIVIAGDGVADGYLGEPEMTAQRFVPEPFHAGGGRMYRTGDLGSWRDGVLYFHGRVDHQIKIRGFRIEPGDIEAAAGTDPAVRECVVVARRFGDNDLRLVLYAAVDGDPVEAAARLRRELRERLPVYMVPQHIEVLVQLPKTANGKIDRKALPAPVAAIHDEAVPTAPDAVLDDPRQAYLATLWRELIGAPSVRASDNFFDVGGHSLLAVAFTTRVQRETGVRLNLLDIATSTLAALASALPAPDAAPAPPAAEAAANGGSLWSRASRLFGRRGMGEGASGSP